MSPICTILYYTSNDLQFRLDTKGPLMVGIYAGARRLKSLLHADIGVLEVVLSHCCCCDTTIDDTMIIVIIEVVYYDDD